jgi:hypothetical protein
MADVDMPDSEMEKIRASLGTQYKVKNAKLTADFQTLMSVHPFVKYSFL